MQAFFYKESQMFKFKNFVFKLINIRLVLLKQGAFKHLMFPHFFQVNN